MPGRLPCGQLYGQLSFALVLTDLTITFAKEFLIFTLLLLLK